MGWYARFPAAHWWPRSAAIPVEITDIAVRMPRTQATASNIRAGPVVDRVRSGDRWLLVLTQLGVFKCGIATGAIQIHHESKSDELEENPTRDIS
jgi:hypothetical protein